MTKEQEKQFENEEFINIEKQYVQDEEICDYDEDEREEDEHLELKQHIMLMKLFMMTTIFRMKEVYERLDKIEEKLFDEKVEDETPAA